jgi:hypothetical protein
MFSGWATPYLFSAAKLVTPVRGPTEWLLLALPGASLRCSNSGKIRGEAHTRSYLPGYRLIRPALLPSPAMTRRELIIPLMKITLGVAIGTYFVWWKYCTGYRCIRLWTP